MSNINTKDYLIYKAVFTAVTADTMLSFKGDGIGSSGSPNIPLYSEMPDWKRIMMEIYLTTMTGAGTTALDFKVLTQVDVATDLTSSSTAAVKGDGSTAFASGNLTTTGRKGPYAMSREGASSAVSNIASVIGVLADKTTLTNFTGECIILVTR